jgi:hypothetical protein
MAAACLFIERREEREERTHCPPVSVIQCAVMSSTPLHSFRLLQLLLLVAAVTTCESVTSSCRPQLRCMEDIDVYRYARATIVQPAASDPRSCMPGESWELQTDFASFHDQQGRAGGE